MVLLAIIIMLYLRLHFIRSPLFERSQPSRRNPTKWIVSFQLRSTNLMGIESGVFVKGLVHPWTVTQTLGPSPKTNTARMEIVNLRTQFSCLVNGFAKWLRDECWDASSWLIAECLKQWREICKQWSRAQSDMGSLEAAYLQEFRCEVVISDRRFLKVPNLLRTRFRERRKVSDVRVLPLQLKYRSYLVFTLVREIKTLIVIPKTQLKWKTTRGSFCNSGDTARFIHSSICVDISRHHGIRFSHADKCTHDIPGLTMEFPDKRWNNTRTKAGGVKCSLFISCMIHFRRNPSSFF